MPESGEDVGIGHDWIGTYTGLQFYLLDPKPAQICKEDIAHHLSLINRYTGATAAGYSVAQHSVLVSELCDPDDACWGLMHDAPEAWYNDLNSPLKHSPPLAGYCVLEDHCMDVVCRKWDLPLLKPHSVDLMDTFVYRIECASFFPEGHPTYKPMPPGFQRIIPWTAEEAERCFLLRFSELFDGR